MKEEKVPHVVRHERGAHDVARKQKDREGGGFHSGRPLPKPEETAGADYKQQQTPSSARKRRFATTGERSEAPGFAKDMEPSDEHLAEKAAARNMSGGKAIRSGAFDSLEQVPKPFSVKKSK